WWISVTSWMTRASGSITGSWVRIGRSSIRQKDTTGAPMRSEPKLGNACAWRPSAKGGHREDLCGGDDALPSTAVDAYLEHAAASPSALGPGAGQGQRPGGRLRRGDAARRRR